MKEKVDEEKERKMLSYFVLFFPTLLIAGIPSGPTWIGLVSQGLVLKLLLAFYQFVVLKRFIDLHYD